MESWAVSSCSEKVEERGEGGRGGRRGERKEEVGRRRIQRRATVYENIIGVEGLVEWV